MHNSKVFVYLYFICNLYYFWIKKDRPKILGSTPPQIFFPALIFGLTLYQNLAFPFSEN